ncbi:E3 ubiquitin-protein ligase UHRF1 [Frankliniella fusca]|uniref:RING-type E3 ubiquitin transferase n=1 Tax=Frankliniella fusca TaxID=407009 RepID=A0AAE1LC20_9NEOP|nr:E3 ubiquitin-protein ligase UHRF1 [Frankliniella fusca]
MYIQIKTADCSQSKRVEVSKLTSVEELKSLVEKELNVKQDRQRLFFRGKQLEDGYKVFDYNINLNDVVMLMIKPDLSAFRHSTSEEKKESESSKPSTSQEVVESKYYKVGDLVEAIDDLYGGWFEGKIVAIQKNTEPLTDTVSELAGDKEDSEKSEEEKKSAQSYAEDPVVQDDGLLYMVSFDFCSDDPPIGFPLKHVRPRMCSTIKLSDIKVGDMVLVNYNIESPEERGFWYDMIVTEVANKRASRRLVGTLYVGRQRTELRNCKVLFTDEVVKILKPKLISERTKEDDISMTTDNDNKRKSAPFCSTCQDNPKRKCKECSCQVCGGKDEPERQLMCDECDMAFHLRCLNPPLEAIPDIDEWYCPLCKNDENEIVKAGDKLKESKKKKKLPSAKEDKTKRDWGKGMACAGRTKECTIVPPNHFGPIPGIDVGTCWKFRLGASEAGVHRPPVSGIHGREDEGAYSIVLSGGYEDDVDNGEEFYYTGSGGRDLSGNKRTSEQSSDQTLTRMNMALARNCNAPVDEKKGAEAKDWKNGKPVRVLRNFKLAKHSKYAPEDGNRYDGIYKLVKYYPQKGESGFKVWRYLFRRDDPAPAPWTKEGKKNIERLGLTMIYPDGYEEMLAEKEAKEAASKAAAKDGANPKKRGRKSVLGESATDSHNIKKAKMAAYELDEETSSKIVQDSLNEKLWDTCKTVLAEGKMKFLAEVQQQFMCICCQEVVFDPVTTVCHHNICKDCLKRSFKAQVYNCPGCRHELGKDFEIVVNEKLASILLHLFPGYEVGR